MSQSLNRKGVIIFLQFVDDLVDGLIALMESDYDKPVNLGSPHEFTIEVMNFSDKPAETARP